MGSRLAALLDLEGQGLEMRNEDGFLVRRLPRKYCQSQVLLWLHQPWPIQAWAASPVFPGSDPEKTAPLEAAALAKAKNVRVYTIGVGSYGTAKTLNVTPFGSHYQMMPVEINEPELRKIADMTGGEYFRATDEENLREIYAQIEKLEKRKIENQHFKSEPPANPAAFLNWAFILALLTWSANYLVFRHND